ARVSFRQVRIALPISADVAVGETRVAAPVGLRKSRMRQRISKRMANEFRGRCVSNEIALLTGLTPCAFGVPVPGFHVQLGVLPIGDSLPSRRQDLLKNRFGK